MGPGGFRRLQNGRDLTSSGWVGSIPTRSRQFLLPIDRRRMFVPLVASTRALTQHLASCLRRGAPMAIACALVACVMASRAEAQQVDSARAGVKPRADTTTRRPARPRPSNAPAVRDSLRPPVSPGKAFFLSSALPGLGQSRLNRPTAGAVYVTAEAVWLAMLAKAANDLRIAKKHQNDVVILSYVVDENTGAPVMTKDGQFTVKDSLRSRYAPPITATASTADQQQRSRVKARRLHLEDWVAMLLFNHLFSGADAFVSSQLWDLPAQVEIRSLPSGIGVGAKIPFR